MFKKTVVIQLLVLAISGCNQNISRYSDGKLKISTNRRFFMKEDGTPFFWLGDTGWLLFNKLDRDEAEEYLENRKQQGFNVIQVMVIHDVNHAVNVYGDSALLNRNVAIPLTTEGKSFTDSIQYDFWDHVDFVISKADEKGLYMALVPVWGSNVKSGYVNMEQARTYAEWLAARYRNKPNIIWLNGGDIRGSDTIDVWNAMGYTFREKDPGHLVTFHPFGRTQSSWWYHDELWLDFNMFQSGHRRYDQDDTKLSYGEDNWKYAADDYGLIPVKPTLDGEPSYEDIPQGLHDPAQPYWTDDDIRRYAYWSVFTGTCGFTYGHNAVMQFYKPGDKQGAYGVRKYWYDGIHDPGAGQMKHLKKLMLSRPFFERIPDNSLIANQDRRYDHLAATRGEKYAFIYTYTGRNIRVVMGILDGKKVKASWFNPRNGSLTKIGIFANEGSRDFNPPGEKEEGNDWVLVLDAR